MAFMVLAINAGMDSAIVDPTNRDMLGLIYAAAALLENDEDGEALFDFIGAHREGIIGLPLESRKK